MDMIKEVREELNLPIAIMLDTKGPEYRIRTFENDKIYLNDGDTFTFTTDEIVGNQNIKPKGFSERFDRRNRVLPVYTIDGEDGHEHKILIPSNSAEKLAELKTNFRKKGIFN